MRPSAEDKMKDRPLLGSKFSFFIKNKITNKHKLVTGNVWFIGIAGLLNNELEAKQKHSGKL